MTCVKLNNFFGCRLSTGSLIIATLGWVLTLTEIISFTFTSIPWDNTPETELNPTEKELQYRLAAGTVLSFITNVLLAIGIYKKNSFYFLPWLVLQCIWCVTYSAITGILLISAGVDVLEGKDDVLFIGGIFLLCLLGNLLSWYCWFCVQNHYLQVKKEESSTAQMAVSCNSSAKHDKPPSYEKAVLHCA